MRFDSTVEPKRSQKDVDWKQLQPCIFRREPLGLWRWRIHKVKMHHIIESQTLPWTIELMILNAPKHWFLQVSYRNRPSTLPLKGIGKLDELQHQHHCSEIGSPQVDQVDLRVYVEGA